MPAVHTQSRHIRVQVHYSTEAHSYWATSPDLRGLAASGDTREELEQDALDAAELLFEAHGIAGKPELEFHEAKSKGE